MTSDAQPNTLVTLPVTYSNQYTPVCGGGRSSGSWPYCYKNSLSDVYMACRGTNAFSAIPTYCITIGY